MDTETLSMPRVHHGKNVKRFRDILRVKQEVLAGELHITQQALSKIEQKEVIEDSVLTKIAESLKIPVETLKNMPDDTAVSIITNTFNNSDTSTVEHAGCYNNYPTYNPVDKIIELYERILEMEREKTK